MSTPALQPHSDLSWKQEVNRRLAAHKNRQAHEISNAGASPAARHPANSRAAQAAARVAARYAQAPSYSQMLAEEARAAVRAAEAASKAAQQAHAAAASVLAELETASAATPFHEDGLYPAAAGDSGASQTTFFDPFLEVERPGPDALDAEAPALEIRWDPDLPVRGPEPASARVPRRRERLDIDPRAEADPAQRYGAPETVEPAQPIFANLIEFPRELIATRKARPRIAEGPLAPTGTESGQLNIFEVDPGAISIEPEPVLIETEPAASGWSRMRLDPEPVPAAKAPAQAALPHAPRSAPFGLRVMAALVDAALIGGLFIAVSMAGASGLNTHLSMKPMEIVAVLALAGIAALYELFFLTYAGTTPGMRYAGIRLRTFDDEMPSRVQLRRRLLATPLSLLPVGLGLLWAIFDEDHLCWHDRISRTYQQ